jgi:DeoR/GlpR family transcriptional regulator of sugar metabolism
MFIEERHQEILNLIKTNGRISIGEIQEKFNVSVDSARRDLRILEEKNLLKRTHGGAIPLNQVGFQVPKKCSLREITNIDENYWSIAKKAVTFIKPNDVVYITSGSVGYFMVKNIPTHFEFTLVTNSIIIADELKTYDNIEIYLVGGKMRQKGTCVDSFATAFVKNLHFDISFLTGAGFSFDFGLSNGTDETATFQRAIIANSRQNIALFPSNKLGFNSFIKVTDANQFDVLITDWDAVEDELLKFENTQIEVIVAEK